MKEGVGEHKKRTSWRVVLPKELRSAEPALITTASGSRIATVPVPHCDNYKVHEGEREENAYLIAAAPDLFTALESLTARYVSLAGSGDCGFWDPEEEEQVIAARAALRAAAEAS